MKSNLVKNYIIFAIILALSIGSLFYILISGNEEIDKTDGWVNHTQQIITKSEELNTLVALMLSSQRGYEISADQSFLIEYNNTKKKTLEQLEILQTLTMDNPSQLAKLEEIEILIINLSGQLEKRITAILSENLQSNLSNIDTIQGFKNNISNINAEFLKEEYSLLNGRIKIVEDRKDQYFYTLLIGSAIAGILLMIFNGYLLKTQLTINATRRALKEKEEMFRLAIEGTEDGVFDWSIKSGEVFYSDQFAAMLGYEPSDFGDSIENLKGKLHPKEKDNVWEYIQYYLDGQLSEYSNIFRMKHKSGQWVWVHSRGKAIFDIKGKPSRLIGIHKDISAAKKYEQNLEDARINAEEANLAKSDFLAHMSHEIRTPLTTISGVAEILMDEFNDFDEKKQQLVNVLYNSSNSLKDLISSVLDFSKIESGELELDEKTFDLGEAIGQIISIMSVKAEEKGLHISFHFEEIKNISMYGDVGRIRQILINLIGNAIKFTDKGTISITINKTKQSGRDILRFDVKDTGIGIEKDHHEIIFQHFKQADSSIARKYGGTGLGLPISKNLAKIMGGNITVESKLGEGSIFSFMLPLHEVDKPINKNRLNDIKEKKISDKLKNMATDEDKILLVEDYEGNIVFLSYILEGLECEFDVAKTGLEAVKLWRTNHYDLILMDIQMPEMDGFTATKKIREIEKEQYLDRTPIIGMTAHALVGDKTKCIEAGMDSYLPKPIVELDLKSTILEYLSHKERSSELT